MALLEEPSETLHPLSYVVGCEHRLSLIGEEAAHQPHEPGVVFGVADHGDQLPQRRRTSHPLTPRETASHRLTYTPEGRTFKYKPAPLGKFDMTGNVL